MMNYQLWIKRYCAALSYYKWYASGSFAILVAIAGSITLLLPEHKATYRTQAILSYQQTSEQASPTKDQIDNQTGNQSSTQNVMPSSESLRSDSVLRQTSDRLQAKGYQTTIDGLRNQITISTDPNQSNRVLIHHRSDAEQESKLIVETFVDAINYQSITDKRQQVEASQKLLENRKQLLEDRLRVAEEKLREFSRQEKPAIQAAVDGSLVSAITNIQQQQRQFQREIEGVDAEMVSLQRQLGMTPEQAYVASALSADTTVTGLIAKVDETRSQIELQRRELQPKHPDIIALEHQKNVDETRLQQRIATIVTGNDQAPLHDWAQFRRMSTLDKARQELANRLINLQTQRQRLAQELGILNRSEPQLRQNYRDGTELKLDLEKRTKEVARYREALDQTEKQLAAIELKKVETRSDWVSADAIQPQKEFNWFLSRPMLLLAGGGLGLLVAGIAVLILDLLRGKILLPEEVQAMLPQHIPLLGILPVIPKQDSKESMPVLTETHSVYLESYELLRSSLHRHSQTQPLKVVVLSSTRKGEGKTVTAYNLAIASAKAGKKTLLIEADLREPSQGRSLGATIAQVGRSNQVADYFQMEQMQPVPDIKHLFVLPSPGSVETVTAVLESEQLQQLLKQAHDEFDFVVIDASALQFSDALLIEPYTDGLVLIVRPDYTDRDSLNIITTKLAEFRTIKFLGSVMNHTLNPKPQLFAP